jgi:Skp family chaperone for outer membrane proteins
MSFRASIAVSAWLAASALGGAAPPADAQVAPASGAPIQGVCIYSLSEALGESQAGRIGTQKLVALQQAIDAELKPTADKLSADAKDLASRRGSTPPAQYQQQLADLQRRARDLDALDRGRKDQLARTHNDAVARISRAATPLFNASAAEHRCALVLDKAPLYSANPAMDLTPDVVRRLNAALPSIDVQLLP